MDSLFENIHKKINRKSRKNTSHEYLHFKNILFHKSYHSDGTPSPEHKHKNNKKRDGKKHRVKKERKNGCGAEFRYGNDIRNRRKINLPGAYQFKT